VTPDVASTSDGVQLSRLSLQPTDDDKLTLEAEFTGLDLENTGLQLLDELGGLEAALLGRPIGESWR
jgi:hypothetical protein